MGNGERSGPTSFKFTRENLQSRIKKKDSVTNIENAVFDFGVMDLLCLLFVIKEFSYLDHEVPFNSLVGTFGDTHGLKVKSLHASRPNRLVLDSIGGRDQVTTCGDLRTCPLVCGDNAVARLWVTPYLRMTFAKLVIAKVRTGDH
ncbi:hypothetical protein Tco_0699619 [Tanacetum coccineum]